MIGARHYEDQRRLKKLTEKSRNWFTGAFLIKIKNAMSVLIGVKLVKKNLKKLVLKACEDIIKI